jgi:hypothetical protein
MALVIINCKTNSEDRPRADSKLNTSHLDKLYEEMKVGDDTIGVVSIYSEFPRYEHVGDDNEGVACVDDASRAAIFYLRQYHRTANKEYLDKAKKLLDFLAFMQAPNGYFYNFIWKDGIINTSGQTSRAEPNWWSWRALWAFGEALEVLDKNDSMYEELNRRRDILVDNILREKFIRNTSTDTAAGLTIPTWLPGGGAAADQASIILTGLTLMYSQYDLSKSNVEKDSLVILIHRLADGIMMMQIKQPDNSYDGAFLSWENIWHAYGNIQSYALLSAGQTIHDTIMIQNALYEIDHFYPSAMTMGGLSNFFVKLENGKYVGYDAHKLPQIAYGYRPMIFACLKAYEVTHEEKYFTRATELAGWFTGKNFAGKPMFDAAEGRGFDGIDETLAINRNSGAESTIESLLSLQALEKAKPE